MEEEMKELCAELVLFLFEPSRPHAGSAEAVRLLSQL